MESFNVLHFAAFCVLTKLLWTETIAYSQNCCLFCARDWQFKKFSPLRTSLLQLLNSELWHNTDFLLLTRCIPNIVKRSM